VPDIADNHEPLLEERRTLKEEDEQAMGPSHPISEHYEEEGVAEDEGEGETDSEEEEEEEPLVKYSTLAPVSELLASQRDQASCITVSEELIVSLSFHFVINLSYLITNTT
jgi:hypothetical protein